MTTHRFDTVSVKATRTWRDANGKKRQTTKTFWQTINPFNKNAAGQPKSYDEIMVEIKAERDSWLVAELVATATGA